MVWINPLGWGRLLGVIVWPFALLNLFEVVGGFWGLSSALSSFFLFMGNLLLYSRLEGVLVFPVGWGSSERGGMSMFYFGHHFFFLFSRCFSLLEWLLTHKGKKYKCGSQLLGGKCGFGWVPKYGMMNS